MNEVAFWFWEGLFMDWMIGKGTNKTHKAVIFQTFDVATSGDPFNYCVIILAHTAELILRGLHHPPKKLGIWRRPKII